MENINNKSEIIKNLKVQFMVNCKCGEKMTNEQLVTKRNKYFCHKCNCEVLSIGKPHNDY